MPVTGAEARSSARTSRMTPWPSTTIPQRRSVSATPWRVWVQQPLLRVPMLRPFAGKFGASSMSLRACTKTLVSLPKRPRVECSGLRACTAPESSLPEMRNGWTFPHGHFLTQTEVDGGEQVMVLGRIVSDRLFGPAGDPIGRSVTLWNQSFRVVGVLDSRSWATPPAQGDDQFDAIYVPVSTVHRLLNLSKLNTITVTTTSAGDTTRIAGEIAMLLRKRHGIGEAHPNDFTVKTQAEQALSTGLSPQAALAVSGNLHDVDRLTVEKLSSSLHRANNTMLALLAGVATVSLLVGGVGVMNLLLLSVSQRTREVGVRVALGARSSDVAAQFVLESVLLSLVGGVLGIACGVLAARAASSGSSTGLHRYPPARLRWPFWSRRCWAFCSACIPRDGLRSSIPSRP